MEIAYQIFESEELLIQKYTGTLEFEKYVRFTQKLASINQGVNINAVIIDFRKVYFEEDSNQFSVNLDKMISLRRDIQERDQRVKNSRIIFWVDTPLPTAVAQMVTRSYNPKSFTFCSTSREIIRVAHLPDSFLDLEKIMSNLENNFD